MVRDELCGTPDMKAGESRACAVTLHRPVPFSAVGPPQSGRDPPLECAADILGSFIFVVVPFHLKRPFRPQMTPFPPPAATPQARARCANQLCSDTSLTTIVLDPTSIYILAAVSPARLLMPRSHFLVGWLALTVMLTAYLVLPVAGCFLMRWL